jgi:hypothetical protein
MKLAFFVGKRPWYLGLIRLRLRSRISHCELVFEPGDGVDALMPDGACAPDAQGALWCASSTARQSIPAWSARRPGCTGGVRFARIVLAGPDWITVGLPWASRADKERAALWFKQHQGALYDWQLIAGFVAWLIPGKANRWACHEACAQALDLAGGHRLEPAALCEIARWRAAAAPG